MPGRRLSLLLLPLLSACAGVPWSSPDPTPAPVDPAVVSAPRAGAPAPDSVPSTPPPVSLAEPLLERDLAADSAADVAALEKLAAAHPPASAETQAGDPLDALSEGPAGFSALDLSTYAEHDRVRYYLDFFLGPARSRMAVWLTRLPVYEPMIRRRFEQDGLPSDLVYLGLIESGFSNIAVSRSRAVGMWQFMRGTARWMGLRVDRWVDERRDPVKATDAAARYLGYLTQKFGSYYLAAAAYNGGPGAVSRGLERAIPAAEAADGVELASPESEEDEEGPVGWTDADFFTLADTRYLRRETKDYVPKLIAAALIARDPVAFGFEPTPSARPFPADSIMVPDMTGLDVIADLAGVTLPQIRELNPHFLRLATPSGRSVVRLPSGTMERVATAYAELPASRRVRFREHFVRGGETLSGIAQRYRVSVAELRSTNPSVRRSSLIRVGQRLVIPTAGVAGPPAGARDEAPRAGAAGHLVRSGETLSGIAKRYRVSVAQLQAWNGIRNPSALRAGQRLVVRGSTGAAAGADGASGAGREHLVRRGETLSGLARRYGVTVQALMQVNGLSSARQLQAGRRIKIPA